MTIKKQIRSSVIAIFTSIIFVSCSNITSSSRWIKTVDGNLIWSDSTKDCSYSWKGPSFDGFALGKGSLVITDSNGKSEILSTNAYYGAINKDEVITVDDGSKYVGETKDNNFEGLGVLSKGSDLYIGQFYNSAPDGKAKWFKNGKLYYNGEWKEGKFDGIGTLFKNNETKSGHWKEGVLLETEVNTEITNGHYQGTIINGQPSGIGLMNYKNGSMYYGSWSKGLWNGKGHFISKTDTITGNWINGKLDGYANHKSSKYIYLGDFADGKPDGNGYYKNNSTKYQGQWIDGQMCGYGEISFSNKDSYSGEFENGEYDGIGKYIFSTGSYYDGEWKKGVQHGYGLYHTSLFEYIGNWEEGWINGEGKISYNNNDFYEGNFVENNKHGYGHYRFANGNCYDGEFVDNKFNGLGVFRFADGNEYRGDFSNGKIKGDGTLYIKTKEGIITITANWNGTNKMPNVASILFPNGDIFEGKLINGIPSSDGVWSSQIERKSGKSITNSINRANEFYKKHKNTINNVVNSTILVLSVVEVVGKVGGTILVTTGVGAPLGAALITAGVAADVANKVLFIGQVTANTASAAVDVKNAIDSGDKDAINKSVTDLSVEVATTTLLYRAPKILKKIPQRRIIKGMSTVAKAAVNNVAIKNSVIIRKNKLFAKTFDVVRNVKGELCKTTSVASTKTVVEKFSLKVKFQSRYLATKIAKTLLNKELQTIMKKPPIKLKKKELEHLLQNPKQIRNFIEAYTGNKKNFQEFFIRLAMADKNQVQRILSNSAINNEIKKRIRCSGEGSVHEWLMTKNFEDFLTNPKWGNDGYYLALALTKLIQKTENIIFKTGGGHVSSSRKNTSASVQFHNGLSKIISSCETKEEVFVKVKQYAKSQLSKESYIEFSKIFTDIFKTIK